MALSVEVSSVCRSILIEPPTNYLPHYWLQT